MSFLSLLRSRTNINIRLQKVVYMVTRDSIVVARFILMDYSTEFDLFCHICISKYTTLDCKGFDFVFLGSLTACWSNAKFILQTLHFYSDIFPGNTDHLQARFSKHRLR